MSYLDQSRRTSPASLAAVAAIHAALGIALVTGLTVSGVIPEREVLQTHILRDPPPPPPPPEVEPPRPRPEAQAADPPIHVPVPPFDLPLTPPQIPTTERENPPLPPLPPVERTMPVPVPDPVPSAEFSPTPAKPRNAGGWLSDADYRPAWVRQELTGTARFRLEIAASGRVSGCTITRSTGHAALDEATCELVAKRARFEPARGRDGAPEAGSYTGSVQWKLPE